MSKTQHERLNAAIDDLADHTEDLIDINSKLNAENVVLHKKLDEMNGTISALTTERDELKEKLDLECGNVIEKCDAIARIREAMGLPESSPGMDLDQVINPMIARAKQLAQDPNDKNLYSTFMIPHEKLDTLPLGELKESIDHASCDAHWEAWVAAAQHRGIDVLTLANTPDPTDVAKHQVEDDLIARLNMIAGIQIKPIETPDPTDVAKHHYHNVEAVEPSTAPATSLATVAAATLSIAGLISLLGGKTKAVEKRHQEKVIAITEEIECQKK